jgi:hypothetical protein
MTVLLPTKDPDDIEPYFIVWCDKATGLNDGSKKDSGILQGASIVTATWTVPTDLTKESESQAAITIAGINYLQDTVTTIWLSGGIAKTSYDLTCVVTLSDGRTLSQTITIPVGEA